MRHKIEKSSDGLFRYHSRVVIPRSANALIKALLFEYHDNVGHPNYRHLIRAFHCDLLSHATSFTSLRPHQAEIEGDNEEYGDFIKFIVDVKIDNWPRRRGPYLQFLTHFVSF